MPLINGKFEPLVLPPKHARVLTHNYICINKECRWSTPESLNRERDTEGKLVVTDPCPECGGLVKRVRYRCLWGGRNGYKDWSVGRFLLEVTIRVFKRVICTREVQKNIDDSIHQLLSDQIKNLGYSEYYTVLDKSIANHQNESSFIFSGLKDMSAKNLKSLEGIDICVIGEAEGLTKKSMVSLDPTIRREDSEVWIVFNPQAEGDFVYDFCVTNQPEDMIAEKVTYLDAPKEWIPNVIREQAETMKRDDINLYNHIYMGECGTEGRFFTGFGPHLKEEPFILHEDAYLYGHLDHGTTAATSFGLSWKDQNKRPHRLMTYYEEKRGVKEHAVAIALQLQAFKWTQYKQPHIVYCDPSMWTKFKVDETYAPSPIDYYKAAFKQVFANSGRETLFVRANNDIRAGCVLVKEMFKIEDGVPNSFYWTTYNGAYEKYMPMQEIDKNDPEKYDTKGEDHIADEARYGFMGMIGSKKESVVKHTKSDYINHKIVNPYLKLQRDTNIG